MIEAFQRLSLTSSQYYTQLSVSQYSQSLIDCPPITKLDSIIVTNFKSFSTKGKVYIGPLLDFTSIIGPNGAGKSNILDALMFCLCNERNKVTFYDLREFIQRDGSETYKEMLQKNKFSEVQVNFELTSKKKLTFKRTLYADSKQQFSIDGVEYPQKVYENFLMKSNLNYMTSNYAIWQGEIDKLILKTPIELTSHLENISGSAFFKRDQDELKKQYDELQEVVNNEGTKLIKLRLEKKNMKKLNNSKESVVKAQRQYEKYLRKMFLVKSYLSELEIREMESEYEKTEKQEKSKIKELNENKVKMQREQAEKIELQNKINTLMKEVAEIHSKLKSLEQGSSVIDVQTMKQLDAQVQSLKRYWQNLTNKKRQLEDEAAKFQSLDVDQEYLSLYNKWEKENEVMNKELAKKKNQYNYSEEILRTKKGILEEFHQKSSRLSKNLEEDERRKREIQASIEEISKSISQMKVENGKISQQFASNRHLLQETQEKYNTLNEKIAYLDNMIEQGVEGDKDKELVKKLSQVSGFKGILEMYVTPAAAKHEICFQIMMGQVLKYLLCTDESSSKQIAARLRENGAIRTLVILGNVNEKRDQIDRATLGKLGYLAIDILNYDNNLNNLQLFLKEYLSGKVVCDNLASAWKILAKNIQGIKEIYTLDGNVLRHDGIVKSHGSPDIIKDRYKYITGSKSRTAIIDQTQALQKERAALEAQMKRLKEKVNSDKISRQNNEIAKLQAKKEELISTVNIIKKGMQAKKQVKIPKGLEKEIQEAESKVEKIRNSMKEIQNEILNSKIFTNFIKKNKIDSLDSFRSLEDLSSLQAKMKKRNKITKQIEEVQRQVAKIQANLNQKEDKLKRYNERVYNTISQDQKMRLLRRLKEGEEEITNMRSRLSKMMIMNAEAMKFKTQLPHLEGRLSLLKQRHEKMIKSEMALLGLEEPPSNKQYKELEQDLGTTLGRATKDSLNKVYSNYQVQSKELEDDLEKQHVDISNYDKQAVNQAKINQEIERITESQNQANKELKELGEKLENVKRDRKSMFMNFFNALKPVLMKTYELLTENNDGFVGKVDLYLENQENPCEEGVYYYPTPPSKRFVYDLDQLSGGEKSLASLALQYSIAITSKSPFLILDEIDAFLDATNVLRFVKMVNKSIKQNALQFVLITHKRSIFTNGQSLVGITKEKDNPFSKAYSLLLDTDIRDSD